MIKFIRLDKNGAEIFTYARISIEVQYTSVALYKYKFIFENLWRVWENPSKVTFYGIPFFGRNAI